MSNIEQIENISDMEKKLSKSEMLRYKKILNRTRKIQYLTAHSIVKDICGENIIVDSNSVPKLKSGFVSIAHKDNWVMVAISDTRVGVDIENSRVNRDFTAESDLLRLPKSKSKKDFYKNFVKYESEFKYGDKISSNIHFYFYEMKSYLIGICTAEPINEIQFVSSDAVKIRLLSAE